MYNNPSGPVAAGAAGSGALAMTGVTSLWLILAAFAMIALGTAVMRIIPRHPKTLTNTTVNSSHWR